MITSPFSHVPSQSLHFSPPVSDGTDIVPVGHWSTQRVSSSSNVGAEKKEYYIIHVAKYIACSLLKKNAVFFFSFFILTRTRFNTEPI